MLASSPTASPIGLRHSLFRRRKDVDLHLIEDMTTTIASNPQNGDRLMPMRVLNPLLALIVPTVGWPWWAIAVQAAFTAIGAELLSTNLALKWLAIGCVIDVGLLLIRSWKLSEKYSFSTLIPDVLVRAIALYLSWALSKEAAFQFEYKGFATNPGELLAVFFMTIVWASAGKSSDKLVFPWPKGLMYIIDKVHSSLDDVSLGDKAFSMFTSFSQRKIGNTEVISKTETVVTTTPEKPEDPKVI